MPKQKEAVLVPDYITVRELADLIDSSPIDVMKKLIANGIMAAINQQIDFDTAAIVLEEMGYDAKSESAAKEEAKEQERAEQMTRKWEQIYAGEKPENLVTRSPIVTILGHVDHGKTTLLDTIRKANVAAGEAGGITQHIGAYRAQHNGRSITFLDTPGHEAFTAMRARGAQGADIAILVVAADDGVMPTTREALNHARAANVPLVVAITKVDKRNANPDIVKQQLAELGVIPDEWDGDTLMVPVAALQGEGIDDLLEAILLVADDHDIVGNPDGEARGIIIESEVDKFKGTLATLLVMNGTLHKGDAVVVGQSHGRIKAMYDEFGNPVKEAGPSTPVVVLGLDNPPQPGERFERVKNDKIARGIVQDRIEAAEAARNQPQRTISLEDMFAQFQAGEKKELNVILKVDVQGSVQPIVDNFGTISQNNKEGIKINVLASDVGNITENDIMLASASDAIIIGFHVDADNAARKAADVHKVEIRLYTIIYKLFEDMELALEGMLDPEYAQRTIGTAEVRQLFKISRVGVIAGSYMREGIAQRKSRARVYRNNKLIVEDAGVSSLKRFNEDVSEIRTGFEFGVSLDGFNEFEEGDLIEFFITERVS